MSDFNYQPLFGANKPIVPRVKSAKFGDGYQQRVGDGININPQTWNLTFTDSDVNIDAIESFFELKSGIDSFTWTPQGASEIRVICKDWNRSYDTPDTDTIQCTFEQVFGE